MKSSTILVGLFALIPSTLAATCTANEQYCGSYLVEVRHWNPATLEKHIQNSDKVPHDASYQDVLFQCSPDGLGISTTEYCRCDCIETGESGDNDRCSPCY